MSENLEKAKALLKNGGYTCVFYNGEDFITDNERGVRPLLSLIEKGRSLYGYSAADKVVGKAAAFLYILLGVKEIYADVMTKDAESVLKKSGINIFGEQTADIIINRAKTGRCPMDSAVSDIDSPDEGLIVIKSALEKIQTGK